jgi:ABC-type dipeptide/oligopeptide/nickel transport system permease subunit
MTAAFPVGARTSRPGALRLVTSHRNGLFGLIIVVLVITVGLAAPLLAPYGPGEIVTSPLQSPSGQHWLGTDELGRDVLSRVIWGARTSLQVSVIATMAKPVAPKTVSGNRFFSISFIEAANPSPRLSK